jgi:hypothetical protein
MCRLVRFPGKERFENTSFLANFVLSMKRFFAAILMVTYLAFSSGIVINYHFCMNELASTKFFGKDTDVCGSCGMHKDKNGCCDDEVVVLKSEEDQSSTVAFSYSIKAPEPQLAEDFPLIESPLQNSSGSGFVVTAPPPLLTGREICVQNRVFRI